MSAPGGLDPRSRYALLDEAGHWRFIGQAWYMDDAGHRVEHHYVRMVTRDAVTGETVERWVDPAHVTLARAARSHTMRVAG